MYPVTERNERKARARAMVLAIGLHLSLGALLYTQMDEPTTTKPTAIEKVNVAKEKALPAAIAVSERP